MKTCDEMMNSLLERRDQYLAAQKKKKKVLLSVTSTLCVVAMMGVALWQSGWMTPPAVTEPQGDVTDTQESTPPTLPSYPILWDAEGDSLSSESDYYDADNGYYGDDGAYCYHYDKVCGVNLGDFLSNYEESEKMALFVRSCRYRSTLFEYKVNGKTIAEYGADLATASDVGTALDAYNQALRDYQKYAVVQMKKHLEQKGFDCYYTKGAEYLIFFATEKEFASLTFGEEEDQNWKYDWATEPMPMLASGHLNWEFVYNGKTVEEHYAKCKYYYDNLETKFYNLIHEEGELLEMGEDRYLTKDPNGNPWPDICGEPFTKQTYDHYVKYYGDMLTKYIVDGEFLKEKAQADWDALKKEKEKDIKLYEEACEASQKYYTDQLKEKLEKLGYACTYTEDEKGVIFYITNQDYITLPLEVAASGSFHWVKHNDDGTIVDVVYDDAEDGTLVNE